MAAKIPTIATEIINSIKVKPRFLSLYWGNILIIFSFYKVFGNRLSIKKACKAGFFYHYQIKIQCNRQERIYLSMHQHQIYQ